MAAPVVYIVPSWALPRTKGGGEPPAGDVVITMPWPGEKRGRTP